MPPRSASRLATLSFSIVLAEELWIGSKATFAGPGANLGRRLRDGFLPRRHCVTRFGRQRSGGAGRSKLDTNHFPVGDFCVVTPSSLTDGVHAVVGKKSIFAIYPDANADELALGRWTDRYLPISDGGFFFVLAPKDDRSTFCSFSQPPASRRSSAFCG